MFNKLARKNHNITRMSGYQISISSMETIFFEMA